VPELGSGYPTGWNNGPFIITRSTRILTSIKCSSSLRAAQLGEALQTLMLNVAQSCNMACKYCLCQGRCRSYARYPRNLRLPSMMPEYVFQQSDTLSFQVSNQDQLCITFIGGEQLLNFAVVSQSIDYATFLANKLYKTVSFEIDTNGPF